MSVKNYFLTTLLSGVKWWICYFEFFLFFLKIYWARLYYWRVTVMKGGDRVNDAQKGNRPDSNQ